MTARELDVLAAEYFSCFATAAPVAASMYGIPGHDHELPDISEDGQERVARELQAIATRTSRLDPADLDDAQRTTRSLLLHECQSLANSFTSREIEWAVGQYSGPINLVLAAIPKVVLDSHAASADYLERCRHIPRYLDQWAVRIRSGIADGVVASRHTAQVAIDQVDRYTATAIGDDPLLLPARHGTGPAVRAELSQVVEDGIRPAMKRLRQLLVEELLPASRPDERCGVLHLPGGEAVYRAAIRQHTTTETNAAELHELGLALLQEIRQELISLGTDALGLREHGEILHGLREDARLRYSSADELVADASRALRRAEDAIPEWCARLPTIDCTIGVMNAAEGDSAVPGYYQPPSDDGSRPGRFWINTARITDRCRFETEALTFHEAVPGHHLQFALARDIEGLPEFRRFAYVGAYGEGWGLYAERLADEMGLYSDALSRLGMLSFDALRASRLVVDTGIHAFGWSRQRAIDFMAARTAVPLLSIANEVDRYINWPGQALSYMTGRETIRRLREDAQARLGASFDLASFHGVVLGSGSVPLDELQGIVHRWLRGAEASRQTRQG